MQKKKLVLDSEFSFGHANLCVLVNPGMYGNIGLKLTGEFEVIEIDLRLKSIELVVKALREDKKLIIKT